MPPRVEQAAQSVVDNAMLTIAARCITLVGVPIALAAIYWSANNINDLAKRLAVVEAQRIVGRAEIIQRIERLEQSDQRDREAMIAVQRQLSSVESTTHAILREIETMRREAILREQRSR